MQQEVRHQLASGLHNYPPCDVSHCRHAKQINNQYNQRYNQLPSALVPILSGIAHPTHTTCMPCAHALCHVQRLPSCSPCTFNTQTCLNDSIPMSHDFMALMSLPLSLPQTRLGACLASYLTIINHNIHIYCRHACGEYRYTDLRSFSRACLHSNWHLLRSSQGPWAQHPSPLHQLQLALQPSPLASSSHHQHHQHPNQRHYWQWYQHQHRHQKG